MSNSVATPKTVAHQAPLSMRFPIQESWNRNRFLFQGMFLTQGLNLCLLLAGRFFTIEPPGISYQFSSVQSLVCPTLCDPMDCSTPGFPVHHQLPELAQTHVHRDSYATHPTISFSIIPFSSCLQSFPASGSFPISQFFTSGGQSTGVSALASVFPMNIQD